MDNGHNTRIERTLEDAKDYLLLRWDHFKLNAVEKSATFMNTVFSIFIVIILVSFGLIFLAVACTWLLANAIGSIIGALFIMAGVFFLTGLIVYLLRKRFITNPLIRMMMDILFANDNDERYE